MQIKKLPREAIIEQINAFFQFALSFSIPILLIQLTIRRIHCSRIFRFYKFIRASRSTWFNLLLIFLIARDVGEFFFLTCFIFSFNSLFLAFSSSIANSLSNSSMLFFPDPNIRIERIHCSRIFVNKPKYTRTSKCSFNL